LFGVEQAALERVILQFGARLEHASYDPLSARSRSFTGLSGSVGANVPLWTGGVIVTNYTTSFRAPALEELYSFGPHPGNLTFEIGDVNLRRERGNGLDVSLRHSANRLRAEANFFYYGLSSYVFLRPTGRIVDSLIEAEYSQGDSRYRGVEARLSAGVRKDLWLHAGLDAVNAQLSNPVIPLPRIPPVRGRIGADYRIGNLSIMPELVLANRQDRVYVNETETAGYGAVNLKALYSVTRKHALHLFGVNFLNASDTLYRNHLSFIKAFTPEIGRGLLFTYTLRFF
jgi:iron complex outermembrane receptor protein